MRTPPQVLPLHLANRPDFMSKSRKTPSRNLARPRKRPVIPFKSHVMRDSIPPDQPPHFDTSPPSRFASLEFAVADRLFSTHNSGDPGRSVPGVLLIFTAPSAPGDHKELNHRRTRLTNLPATNMRLRPRPVCPLRPSNSGFRTRNSSRNFFSLSVNCIQHFASSGQNRRLSSTGQNRLFDPFLLFQGLRNGWRRIFSTKVQHNSARLDQQQRNGHQQAVSSHDRN